MEEFLEFDDYQTLVEHYPTQADFVLAVGNEFGTNFDDVMYATSMSATFKIFIENLSKAIYRYYKRDKIAYLIDMIFVERLTYDLAENVNKYFQEKNIQFMIGSNTDTKQYVLTSTMDSTSKEVGMSGSSVLQSSASTPTGVSPNATGNQMSVELSKTGDKAELDVVNNGFVDKYTGFQGKTNGLHKNDVDRDTNLTRGGSFLIAIEMLNKLPKTFIEEVLKDVSHNFIVTY